MRYLLVWLLLWPGLASADVLDEFCLPEKNLCAFFSPSSPSFEAVSSFINSARRNIKLAAYGMKVSEFVPLIEYKLQQGVSVTLLIDYKNSKSKKQISHLLQPHPLLTVGQVPVLRGRFPQMHNKFIIVDDKAVITGSGNFSHHGLAGNFENFVLLREPVAIKPFLAEYNELYNAAIWSCELLSDTPQLCGTARVTWPSAVDELFSQGSLPKNTLVQSESSPCYKKLGVSGQLQSRISAGLLTSGQQPRVKDITGCFYDQKLGANLQELLKRLSNSETYWNNSPVRKNPITGLQKPMERQKIEVYFGPEDNLTAVIDREFEYLLENPSEAYFYGSLNFFTQKTLAIKLKDLEDAGGHVRLIYDGRRGVAKQMATAIKQLKNKWLLHNSLADEFGMNHNKFAIFGRGQQVAVITGSANWTGQALGSMGENGKSYRHDPNDARNDENMVLVRNPDFASIYMREWLSQYRYILKRAENSDDWKSEVQFLNKKLPCLMAVLGQESNCQTSTGELWKPKFQGRQITGVTLPNSIPPNNALVIGSSNVTLTSHLFLTRPFPKGDDKTRWLAALPTKGFPYSVGWLTREIWQNDILLLAADPYILFDYVTNQPKLRELEELSSPVDEPNTLWRVFLR